MKATADREPGTPGLHATATLAIEAPVLQAVHAGARASTAETMGLLASHRAADTHVITAALPLHAACTPGSAEASPDAVIQACAELAAADLVPRGLYHSHPAGVQESATDRATLRRIAVSIAAYRWERPARGPQPPAVSGPARALLPGDDATLTFTIRGRPVPQLDAHEPARWARMTVNFDPSRQSPEATLTPHRLTLSSAGVQLELELPAGTSVAATMGDSTSSRYAEVVSLIVNRWGQQQAYAVRVLDAGGRTLCEPVPCQIVVADRESPAPGHCAPDASQLQSRP